MTKFKENNFFKDLFEKIAHVPKISLLPEKARNFEIILKKWFFVHMSKNIKISIKSSLF